MVAAPLLLLLLCVIGKITYKNDFFLEDALTMLESSKKQKLFTATGLAGHGLLMIQTYALESHSLSVSPCASG